MTATPSARASARSTASPTRGAASRVLRLGTRGSALALAQAGLVAAALRARGVEVELVTIETAGDRRAPDSAWGEGAFVTAIERELLGGRVDVAVHSAKDVPTALTPGTAIAAYLPREDARDALVVRPGAAIGSLADLPPGARVGTDSPRRTGFLLAARPDLRIHPIHGNVDTRLRRLDAGETDALVLAVAGLARLGRADRIAERLSAERVAPAPGQGAIAVQVRSGDEAARTAVADVDDQPTRLAVEAERAFLAATGGGCRAPVGSLARLEGDALVLFGAFVAPDGSRAARAMVRGPVTAGPALASELARALGRRLPGVAAAGDADGAGAAVGGPAASRPRVLVTRPAGQSGELAQRLAEQGLEPVVVPAIAIEPLSDPAELDAAVRAAGGGWIAVTSPNGAHALVAAFERLGRPTPADVRLAAVGGATASILEAAGLPVTHTPGVATARRLGAELPVEPGEHVLLVRGDLAGPALPDILRERGARVGEVVAYRTVEAPDASRRLLDEALAAGPLDAIVLTSASTVRGLLALAGPGRATALVERAAICAGPETATAARAAGFSTVVEARRPDGASLARTVAAALHHGRPADHERPAPGHVLQRPTRRR